MRRTLPQSVHRAKRFLASLARFLNTQMSVLDFPLTGRTVFVFQLRQQVAEGAVNPSHGGIDLCHAFVWIVQADHGLKCVPDLVIAVGHNLCPCQSRFASLLRAQANHDQEGECHQEADDRSDQPDTVKTRKSKLDVQHPLAGDGADRNQQRAPQGDQDLAKRRKSIEPAKLHGHHAAILGWVPQLYDGWQARTLGLRPLWCIGLFITGGHRNASLAQRDLCPFLLLGTGESLLMLFNFEILQKEYNHCPYDRYPTLLGKGIWQGMA